MPHPTLLPRTALLLLICVGLLTACGQPAPAAAPTAVSSVPAGAKLDLSGLKAYLVQKTTALTATTAKFRQDSDRYYELAKAANFDYTALWQNQRAPITQAIERARGDWITANPIYEQMEGIVAGTPGLVQYDVILDAGLAGSDNPEEAAPFDLTLPDGRTLPRPGNLFGVTESTLWGTDIRYIVPDLLADYNGNGSKDFGETLPDANLLKSAVDALDKYANELHVAGQAWQPAAAEAFGALINNVPTVPDFFEAWKESRFVAGAASKRRDFVVVSRLSDIIDNITSWQVIYQDLSPAVRGVDAAQDAQISEGLTNLKSFVGDLYAQEQGGKRFSPEEADLLTAEAGNRATAIAGQISQVAAKLNVPLQQ